MGLAVHFHVNSFLFLPGGVTLKRAHRCRGLGGSSGGKEPLSRVVVNKKVKWRTVEAAQGVACFLIGPGA